MQRKQLTLLIVAVLVAATCVRLGVWQLSRRSERRAANALIQANIDKPPIQATNTPPEFERFRQVVLQGRYDYEHELVAPNRSRNGSPGVHILTPLIITGNDTAVLVNRGWVYSGDGKTVELKRWREEDVFYGKAYMNTAPERTIPALTTLPYPVKPYQAVVIGNPGPVDRVPPRVEIPPLSEGNHFGYAIQWFSFAVIALVGTFIFVRKPGKPHESRLSE